jgi:hypothetical protein
MFAVADSNDKGMNMNPVTINRYGQQYIRFVKTHSPERWDSQGRFTSPPWYQILLAVGQIGITCERTGYDGIISPQVERSLFAKIGFVVLNAFLWWREAFPAMPNRELSDFLDASDPELIEEWGSDDEHDLMPLLDVATVTSNADPLTLRRVIAYRWLPILEKEGDMIEQYVATAINELPLIVESGLMVSPGPGPNIMN